MKKQILSLAVVSTLSLGSLLSPLTVDQVKAASISDLQKQKEELQNKRSGINAEISQKKSKIDELQSEQEKVNEQIKTLDFAVAEAEEKIQVKNAQIDQTTGEIEQLKVEIAELMKRIEQRNELLKDKARSFQENGGTVNYIDVLLGANSFSDFVDRVSAVTTIVQADKNILEQHKQDKLELETKQQEVETKLENLKEMKSELEVLKVELNTQIKEKNKLMSTLKQEEEQMEAAALSLAEEGDLLAAQQGALQQAIALEKKRQAQIAEAARKAELERQRAAASAKKSGSSTSTGDSQAVSAPPASGGMIQMPTNGRITSNVGARWGSFHAGLDVANKASNVPIVAAADGVVIRSYYSSSYGNVIFVAHSLNGQTWTTVYAHMSDRRVGNNEVVTRGQRIGTMGNTGQSFGQHLHFELHKGSWNASKSNAVNPLAYM
ncbi:MULTISPECIES: murein hydrolase activator EnvC family protein [Mesobacillus]|uniref:Peptidoglycan DD-metalloendopeptidase family protein n=1 Tax=Mesobacillus jeotgali TaxID=129985 RepID=A0ABY9VFJ5_9BACI|nr:M23 family metallopeptidase [Mesobacillus jeotgali]MCM3574089.1 peptidoglycan DD-metalloendopeptidase family protein [Mesobacillus subterraneus]UYZ21589.1 peptidoglycan DD-metalloendopeptidase family protein [Mesobacillus jeotgali]WNF22595.1 peptidoglycan DD-metalloendopeptidase family protein [Mesobacillus jeotgali]